jgi:signal transduction histidine kinase
MNVRERLATAVRSIDLQMVDVLPAVVLWAVMTAELALVAAEPYETPAGPAAYLWAALITLPIALHRRFPVAVVLVTAAAIVGYAAAHYVAFPGYAAFALVFLVSLHGGRGRGALAGFLMAAALAVGLLLQPVVAVTPSTWVVSALLVVVAWLAGENIRSRQARWEALRERAGRLEADREERARQAVAAERLRIARELHDVVAHAMSVVAVQAGVAHHVIDQRPELARQALGTVETTTRAALVEMRRLLGVLRRPDEPSAALAPAPGLAAVPDLVAQLADVGLTVRVRADGERDGVPDGVDLSAYRIVQEGLTNVLRYGGPVAEVVLGYRPGEVRVVVTDDGRAGPAQAAGAGHGLIGMRERVAVFGGEFSAGPRPEGGFRVSASLPYGEAPAGRPA